MPDAKSLLADRQYGATQGIDITNRNDTQLLNSQINNPAVVARYPLLANPNNVYPDFPRVRRWAGLAALPAVERNPAFPRAAHGKYLVRRPPDQGEQALLARLDRAGGLYLAEELTNGTNSNTSYVTPSAPLINDVFNKSSISRSPVSASRRH